jgi:hypothetical protein
VSLTLPPSMAPPSSFAGVTGAQAFADFVRRVSDGTGISQTVVTAWVLSEDPADKTDPKNPLNIKNPAYHGRDYVDAAAKVVELLHTPRYAPVLAAAKVSDAATIDAIARSPWDEGHYAGKPGAAWGTLLRGVYERVKGKGVHATTTPGSIIPSIPNPIDAAKGAVGDAVGQATAWAEGAGLRALGYLTLTVLAVGLFLAGVVRLTGIGPGFVRGAMAERRAGAAAVPF